MGHYICEYLDRTDKKYDKRFLNIKKKSRIQETKHLLTDADSSTNAIGRWTKNTQKPDFFDKRKKSPKTQ